ncbi:unnamed protein product, partial [Symbiodinium sp. CCMP2592]
PRPGPGRLGSPEAAREGRSGAPPSARSCSSSQRNAAHHHGKAIGGEAGGESPGIEAGKGQWTLPGQKSSRHLCAGTFGHRQGKLLGSSHVPRFLAAGAFGVATWTNERLQRENPCADQEIGEERRCPHQRVRCRPGGRTHFQAYPAVPEADEEALLP